MKYGLTKEALNMKANDFAINFGINTKTAIEAFVKGEIEIVDPAILAGLKVGVMAEVKTGKQDEDGYDITEDVYMPLLIEQKEKQIKKENIK